MSLNFRQWIAAMALLAFAAGLSPLLPASASASSIVAVGSDSENPLGQPAEASQPLRANTNSRVEGGEVEATEKVDSINPGSLQSSGGCVSLPRTRTRGANAVNQLGSRIAEVAEPAGMTGKELRQELLADETLWVDRCGRPFYVESAASVQDLAAALESRDSGVGTSGAFPSADTFRLHSRPGSRRTIYLDFDGYDLSGTLWAESYNNGVGWNASPWDTDGNPAVFSSSERDVIQAVWEQVSEDFAPFDVDVTTEDPGFDAIDRSAGNDDRYGTRAVITDDTVIGSVCDCGGLAYVGVFNQLSASEYQPAFIFGPGVGDVAKYIADATSHEIGHNIGLSHDGKNSGCGSGGTESCAYYEGHGAWIPIMGSGYQKPISQWSKGEYSGATNTEDDFAVAATNGLGLVADDHGDTTTSATGLSGALPIGAQGTISTPGDVDFFSFTSTGVSTTVSVSPAPLLANLDAKISLYDSSGVLIGSNDSPSALVSESLASGLGATYVSAPLGVGTYYVAVDGVGQGSVSGTGYSDYGSLGRYSVSVATSPGPAVSTASLPNAAAGVPYVSKLQVAGGSGPYTWTVISGSLPAGLTLGGSGSISGTPLSSTGGTFTVRVTDSASRTTTRTFTIAAGLAVTTKIIPEATVGSAYSSTLAASGGSGNRTWTIESGSLPTGLSMATSGQISGTASSAMTRMFTVRVGDGALSETKEMTLTVSDPLSVAASPMTFATLNLGVEGSVYPAGWVDGGRPSYVLSLASGSLPTGMRLNDVGTISGTPTSGGTFSSTVNISDRNGRSITAPMEVKVKGFNFAPASLPVARSGSFYSQTLSASYGGLSQPLAWTLAAGQLPSGMSLSASGVVSGTGGAIGAYPFTARVTDAKGWSDTSIYQLVVATTPSAPTSVSAVAGQGSASLTWSAPTSNGGMAITGYVVTPFIGANPQSPITFGSTATSQSVAGLVNGTSYTFKVAAKNVFGEGEQSSSSNPIVPRTVPAQPTGVTGVAGVGQVGLSWNAPGADGGSPVTGYVITPYIGASARPSLTFHSDATTQIVTGLTNGTTYTFKVAAINVAGTGLASTSSNSVTPVTVPDAPGPPSVAGGNSKVTVSWTAPAFNGGSAVTGYVVTPSIGSLQLTPITFSSTATSQTVEGLTNGTTYTFKVAAINAVGTGAQSAPSTAVTPAPVAPGAPTALLGGSGDRKVTLSWVGPSDNGGSSVTGYVVTPFIGSIAQTHVVFNSALTTQTVTGLTNGTSYSFRVAAINAIGTGPMSESSGLLKPVTVPGAPGSVGVTGGDARVTVSWTPPSSNGGTAITGYVVTPYIGGTAQSSVVFNSTLTTQSIVGLTNGTAYTFRVSAVNVVGGGPQSSPSAAVTPMTVPGAPSAVTATATNSRASLTWTPPSNNGGSPVTGYVVTPYVGSDAQNPVSFSSTATAQTITGLTNGVAYTFRVAAKNAVGIGSGSLASVPVTPAPTVPGAPASPSGVSAFKQVTLSWVAPDDGGSLITGYIVTPYIGGVAQGALTFNSASTTQTISGLSTSTTYTFKVAARNAVGQGPNSDESASFVPRMGYHPASSWSELVARLFVDLTAKSPTPTEHNAWVTRLTSGASTKGELVESLRRGSENTSNVDPAARLYRAFLGRTPDSGGLKFWVTRRRSGAWSLTRMADYFASSSEFRTKYGMLTNRAFITRIYTDVLGRAADQAGVNFWTAQLDAKKKTRGQIMVGFSESSEYKRLQAQNTDVAVVYIYLAGRTPTSFEVDAWTLRQRAGTELAALAQELLDAL